MGKISAFYTMPHPPIIIPEVGRGEEKKIQNTYDACTAIGKEVKKIKPDTIILITPHGPVFRDAIAISNDKYIAGDLGQFRAPEVNFKLKINKQLTSKIMDKASREDIFMAPINKSSASNYGIDYSLDHGSLVPLYFINKEYPDYEIIHITYGILPKLQLYKLGMIIKDVIESSSSNAVLIGSGDLSHKLAAKGPYEYDPDGEWFDKEIMSLLEKGDVRGIFNMDPNKVAAAGECGLRSFYTMLGAMNGNDIRGELLSYEGTFGVGYGVMRFDLKETNVDMYKELIKDKNEILNKKRNNEGPYTRLAREGLTHYLSKGDYMDLPDYLPSEMLDEKRGVFVTLYKEGSLRGCIGTIFPRMNNIAEEIIRNAVSAGIHDSRFDPVSQDEVEDLDFSVDVLTEPKPATKSELDPKVYGVIVKSGVKTGLLLPDLDGVDSPEYQLSIALEKAGIMPHEPYTIEKFKVIRHR